MRISILLGTFITWASVNMVASQAASCEPLRRVMYLTGQHNIVPDHDDVQNLSHVILAFMRSDVFHLETPPDPYPLFTTVDEVRLRFGPQTKIMVAIGGWGDSHGFEKAAETRESREAWTKQVKTMVDRTGCDGIDIDWEYPGGNRDDYREVPNSERVWEIEAYVSLLESLRLALGPDKVLSIATPGCERDLMSFTSTTLPRIVKQVDFINVMTYDLMNRRDTVVKHHSGVEESMESVQRYIDRGALPSQLNLGLGYYVKWFMADSSCSPAEPLGCPTQLLEDPVTGGDLGKTGAFSWHDEVPNDLADSFSRARSSGKYFADGTYGYLDEQEHRWWSFDTPRVIKTKVRDVLSPMDLGGIFAWGLGEDAPKFASFEATMRAVDELERPSRDEL